MLLLAYRKFDFSRNLWYNIFTKMREGQKNKTVFFPIPYFYTVSNLLKDIFIFTLSPVLLLLWFLQNCVPKISFSSVSGFPKFDNLQKMWYNIITKMREKIKKFFSQQSSFTSKREDMRYWLWWLVKLLFVVSSALLLCHKDIWQFSTTHPSQSQSTSEHGTSAPICLTM